MPTPLEYSLLGQHIYKWAPLDAEVNKIPDPELWAGQGITGWRVDPASVTQNNGGGVFENGFEGAVYVKGNDVVVAYAGTDQSRDMLEDLVLFASFPSQLVDAAHPPIAQGLIRIQRHDVVPRVRSAGRRCWRGLRDAGRLARPAWSPGAGSGWD